MIKEAIKKVIEDQDLSIDESRGVINQIMSGEASPPHTAAFLTALRCKGETVDEILGAAQVMRERARRIPHKQEMIFDNCGTGGDGAGTFNISTTASFVIAACGIPVGKHGNRSVSSQCGSADLLQELGANLDLSPEQSGQSIDEIGIGFLFAPALHPAMKAVVPIRKELGFRTVFNLLGPLTNPAFATHQLIGVFDGAYTDKIAQVARAIGIKSTMVVYSQCHIDELTTAGLNEVSVAQNGTCDHYQLNPQALGFASCDMKELAGGDARENAGITISILKGEKSPRRDTVLLNAAAALTIAEKSVNLKEGIKMAEECIDSRQALRKLNDFIEFSRSFGDA
ncbi:MAG: anthranilate phosphoribosyltransferase [candidate division Zixibacteria bacterium]